MSRNLSNLAFLEAGLHRVLVAALDEALTVEAFAVTAEGRAADRRPSIIRRPAGAPGGAAAGTAREAKP